MVDIRSRVVAVRRIRHWVLTRQTLPHETRKYGERVRWPESIVGFANDASDRCLRSPGRSLVIAVHCGGPDWGSGPSGVGKLFKVARLATETPTPSLAWAAGPQEVRIAFDRPVDSYNLQGLAARAAIEGGDSPPPATAWNLCGPAMRRLNTNKCAMISRRHPSIQLTADRRTSILSTAPQFAAVNYAIAIASSAICRDSRDGPRITPTARHGPSIRP